MLSRRIFSCKRYEYLFIHVVSFILLMLMLNVVSVSGSNADCAAAKQPADAGGGPRDDAGLIEVIIFWSVYNSCVFAQF